MKELCFWSVADKQYAYLLQNLVNTFRDMGMKEDFHVFCDRPIQGAETHLIEDFEKKYFLFKFLFLQNLVKKLDYQYFVFLDADNVFVRKPPSLLELMQGSPIHAFFESDCTAPSKRPNWHKCPLPEYVEMMRECGVASAKIYNVNAGFFIIKREAIDLACGLAIDFWKHALLKKYVFTEEPPLAYVMHMLCIDPEKHLLRNRRDVWCTDWLGEYAGRLPDGKPWAFADYMTGERYTVDPAIVHAIKSKEALIAAGGGDARISIYNQRSGE